LLERQHVIGVLEVVEELDLRKRQLQLTDRFEQVVIAVLVQVDDERVEILGQRCDLVRPVGFDAARAWLLLLRGRYLHACNYCTQVLIVQLEIPYQDRELLLTRRRSVAVETLPMPREKE